MSLLFTLSTCLVDSEESNQSKQSSRLRFGEILAKNIDSQLVDFPKVRTFRFWSFLLNMFVSFNEENMQLPKMEITNEISRNYRKFIKFLMSEFYNAFFKQRIPIILPQMRETSQFSPEKRIGDWFLSET